MHLIPMLVLGLLAGFIGSKIVDNRGRGMVIDIILGVVGSMVGGSVFRFFGAVGVTGLNLWSLLVATVGAVITLTLAHFIRRML